MKKIFIYLLIFLGFSMSCTKDFEEFNTDIKNPPEVEGEFLIARAQKELMDQTTNSNVNLNIFRLIAQYWTETTYTDEANYDLVNRTIPDNLFDRYYRWILKPLKEARELITAKELPVPYESEASRTNELMIIKLMEVFAYHDLVSIFGNVPYGEALDIENLNPVYEDQAVIFADLLTQIDVAIDGLDINAQEETTFAFKDGKQDFFYEGDVASWITFANSLKLKIAIMLADVNPGLAQPAIEAAVAAGVMTSVADEAIFPYQSSSPNTNGIHEDLILSGRKDFVVANTCVDVMKNLADPRMDAYFEVQFDTAGNGTFEYIGGVYGASSSYSTHTHVDPKIEEPTFPGMLMTYNEVLFYLAEAAERGYSVGMTAQAAYEAAVTASFDWWDVDGAAAYLATPAADYTAAADHDARMELIGVQSYVAFYTRGLIAWNQYRRFDVPQMNIPEDYNTPNGEVPTRFIYPINEQTLNADNYNAAAAAIGGDNMVTLLFWDLAAPAK